MDEFERGREAIGVVEDHVREFFDGHEVESVPYDLGTSRRGAVPGLRILVVGPGPRGGGWSYLTAGCWLPANEEGQGHELLLTAPARDEGLVELLAMVAFYHATRVLAVRHSVPIGKPWVPGSACDHLLAVRPALHGPSFEHCLLPEGRVRFLQLLPVTAAELAFRREFGHEALERVFSETSVDPADPQRLSAV